MQIYYGCFLFFFYADENQKLTLFKKLLSKNLNALRKNIYIFRATFYSNVSFKFLRNISI